MLFEGLFCRFCLFSQCCQFTFLKVLLDCLEIEILDILYACTFLNCISICIHQLLGVIVGPSQAGQEGKEEEALDAWQVWPSRLQALGVIGCLHRNIEIWPKKRVLMLPISWTGLVVLDSSEQKKLQISSSDHLKVCKEDMSRKLVMLGKSVHTGLQLLPIDWKQLLAHK